MQKGGCLLSLWHLFYMLAAHLVRAGLDMSKTHIGLSTYSNYFLCNIMHTSSVYEDKPNNRKASRSRYIGVPQQHEIRGGIYNEKMEQRLGNCIDYGGT